MNSSTLLIESLDAALNYERCKVMRKDLERAQTFLSAAEEYMERLVRRLAMIESYDHDKEEGLPWTLINTKQELIEQAEGLKKSYERSIQIHHEILAQQITNH